MSEYDKVRIGKLKLKGEKPKSKKRKHKKQDKDDRTDNVRDEDTILHGGWWKTTAVSEITGTVAIEFGNNTYVKALDNGLFTLGAPHEAKDGPSPEEILTAFPVNETKIAFKSGYGKYLGIDKNGVVVGRSDAVGALEQWEPIFEGDKMALLSGNERFMTVTSDDDITCERSTAGPLEMLTIRSLTQRNNDQEKDTPAEEQGSITEVEVNYVRKFQKFQDKKLRINTESRTQLEQAKTEGTLHEALLDRRSKMKADRYCK